MSSIASAAAPSDPDDESVGGSACLAWSGRGACGGVWCVVGVLGQPAKAGPPPRAPGGNAREG